LKKLIKEYDITTIVVGLPYDLYGKNLKQLEKTNLFIQKLKNIFPNQKID
jgi:RNase H-fold protein (predicted Holliday junction resolvase)